MMRLITVLLLFMMFSCTATADVANMIDCNYSTFKSKNNQCRISGNGIVIDVPKNETVRVLEGKYVIFYSGTTDTVYFNCGVNYILK